MSLFFNFRPIRTARRKSTGPSRAAMLKRRSSPMLATFASQRAGGTPLRSIPRRRTLRSPAYHAAAPSPRMFRVS